jgi:hypothetical protein
MYVFNRYGMIKILCSGIAMVALCSATQAQRLIVVTNTLSAMQETAGIYVQSLDMDWKRPFPGALAFPGEEICGQMLPTRLGAGTVLSTMTTAQDSGRGGQGVVLRTFQNSPFGTRSRSFFGLQSFRNVKVACLVEYSQPDTSQQGDDTIRALMVLAEEKELQSAEIRWWLKALALMPDGSLDTQILKQWELPGAPLAAISLSPGDTRVVVLCKVPSRALLCVIDLAEDTAIPVTTYPLASEDVPDAVPSGLAVSGNLKYIFALISGFALNKPGGETVSRLHVLDSTDFSALCEPIALTGTAQVDNHALQPTEAGCWIATQIPGTDFAYATRVQIQDKTAHKQAEYALVDVSRTPHIAVAPAGNDVAVAMENRLELWPGGLRPVAEQPGNHHVFDADIRVVQWMPEGLLVGEGGRIHAFDSTGQGPRRTIQLQSGWVSDILIVPGAVQTADDSDGDGLTRDVEIIKGTSPHLTDTDQDSIPDGLDPEPLVPSPLLSVPPIITFHGEAVGRELRAIQINSGANPEAAWQVSYNQTAMPWLKVFVDSDLEGLNSGRGNGRIYMAVTPEHYVPGMETSGEITIALEGTHPHIQAAGSPATVRVQVDPPRGPLRRILWLWAEEDPLSFRDDSDPRNMDALADLLASAPYHFAHHEVSGPFRGDLAPYAIVVLDATAVLRGVVTRQAMLDYVARGGALLLLGEYLNNDDSRILARWLAPAGIRLAPARVVTGEFPATDQYELIRHWDNFSIRHGAAIIPDSASGIVAQVQTENYVVFLAKNFGYGRIAVLADAAPLESDALNEAGQGRLFAADLFRWMARAGLEFEDFDGDGLPNHIEDQNNNNSADDSETDFLDPDTDKDGLPDGMEDANRNGVVEEGESDPRNADSDEDGVLDGADIAPRIPEQY